MKKKDLRTIPCTLVTGLFIILSVSLQAQVSNPSTWGSFVNGNGNILVSDTFRIQTFNNTQADNWLYTTDGGATLFDARADGFTTQKGEQSLKLPTGSNIRFTPYPLNHYRDVTISVNLGDKDLMIGENLTANTYRTEGNTQPTLCNITHDGLFELYKPIRISKNPPALDLFVSPAATNTKNGYYCIDNIYAYGSIPQYSLFTGTGNWNDTLQWSHLPAARNRNALIGGDITVDGSIQCNDLLLSSGTLTISNGAHLCLNNLTLFENTASVVSTGQLTVKGQLTLSKTFQDKGKWYFISFPFDVYENGIDSHFKLKDGTFNGSGNYFYVQTYDGEKRALSSSSQGNWTVVSSSASYKTQPLFEKNKGYLIALDAAANTQTLTFTSKVGDIPANFGKEGSASIKASLSASGGKEHSGWFLCGNPLPHPVALSQIEDNPDLDGNIYMYQETGYKTYSVGSNYILPPFCAFFVKAATDTELTITNTSYPTKGVLLYSTALSTFIDREPISQHTTTAISGSEVIPAQTLISGKELHLVNIPDQGIVHILDFQGQVLYKQSFPAGTSNIPLILKPGMYILNISTDRYQNQHKFTISSQ